MQERVRRERAVPVEYTGGLHCRWEWGGGLIDGLSTDHCWSRFPTRQAEE